MTAKELYYKAAVYCSRAEHSCLDVKEKLLKWGLADEQQIALILSQLEEESYLNEQRFALAFVKDKFRFNKWGRKKIAYALYQKGVSEIIAQEALSSISEEDYLGLLQELLKSKGSRLKSKDKYDEYAKLMRFATSRGFEPDLVAKQLSSVLV